MVGNGIHNWLPMGLRVSMLGTATFMQDAWLLTVDPPRKPSSALNQRLQAVTLPQVGVADEVVPAWGHPALPLRPSSPGQPLHEHAQDCQKPSASTGMPCLGVAEQQGDASTPSTSATDAIPPETLQPFHSTPKTGKRTAVSHDRCTKTLARDVAASDPTSAN